MSCSPDSGTTLSSPTFPCGEDADCSSGDTCEEFGGTCNLGSNTCNVNSAVACNSDADCLRQDTCGDIDSGASPIVKTITGVTILCLDTDDDGLADLPNCLSWRQPSASDLCLTPLAAFPDSPSKCNCDLIPINGIPVPKTIQIVKDLSPDGDAGRFDLTIDGLCDLGTNTCGNLPGTCSAGSSSPGELCASDADCTSGSCEGLTACTADLDCGGLADAGEMDTTDPVPVDPGVNTVRETAGAGTILSAYSTDIACVETVGTCTGDSSI